MCVSRVRQVMVNKKARVISSGEKSNAMLY